MSFLRVSFAFLVTVAGATHSFAQDATPSAPAGPETKPAKVHKICRQDVATGSIMPRTTCHTKEDWAAIDVQNQQEVDRTRSHRGVGTTGQ